MFNLTSFFKKTTFVIFAFWFCSLTLPSANPDWKTVLEESKLIAKVEFVSDGEAMAPAKILEVFKGDSIENEIWVSSWGYSQNKIKTGDQAIVFLNNNFEMPPMDKFYKRGMKKQKIKEEQRFRKAHLKGHAFFVPSAYFLIITENTIAYDLTSPQNEKPIPQYLNDFEAFLRVIWSTDKHELHDELLAILNTDNIPSFELSQYIMMLYFSGYSDYSDIIAQLRTSKNEKIKYALVTLLGNMRDEQSRLLLCDLLKDPAFIDLQEEIVESMAENESNESGKFLLDFLLDGKETLSPDNYNLIEDVNIIAIRALGRLKYKPAVNAVIPLLGANNQNKLLFRTSIETILSIEPNFDFLPHFNAHLKNEPNKFWYTIASAITSHNFTNCSSFIENAIRQSDRSETYGTVLIMSLAHFDNTATHDFLKEDFTLFLTKMDQFPWRSNREWLLIYLNTFSQLKMTHVKNEVYHTFFTIAGIGQEFAQYPQLFQIKKELEDSLKQTLNKNLTEFEAKEVIAYIQNPKEVGAGAKPIATYAVKLHGKFDYNYYGEVLFTKERVEKINQISKISAENMGLLQLPDGNYDEVSRLAFNFDSRLKGALLNYLYNFGDQKDKDLVEFLEK